MRHGFSQYFIATRSLYIFASAVFHVNDRLYLLGAAAMMWGWLPSAMKGPAMCDDLEFHRFLRRFRWSSLIIEKARAIE